MTTAAPLPDIRLRSEQTGGAVSIIEVTVSAGWAGPPLHHHLHPAGFERYFARMAADPPAWAAQPYPETTVVGPRIGAGAP